MFEGVDPLVEVRGMPELAGLGRKCLDEILGQDFGMPATSKMYFSGYNAVSCPPACGRASTIRAVAPRIPA